MENVSDEDILSKIGAQVIITYKHIHGGQSKRKGFLQVDKGWIYLYDSGKSGNNFNCAFMMYPTKKHLDLIISIERV